MIRPAARAGHELEDQELMTEEPHQHREVRNRKTEASALSLAEFIERLQTLFIDGEACLEYD